MALIGLIDLDEPLGPRADAVLTRALREAGVMRVIAPAEAATLDRGDRVLLVGADTLLDGTMTMAMAEGVTATLATLPNELPTARYELIDGATRWAGWAALPGEMVAETAQTLDPEWSLASTLVRRAVQAGALRVDAGRTGALIALDAPDAVAAIDRARLRTAMQPLSGVSGRIVERLALLVAEPLLETSQSLRWAAGATAALLAVFAAALWFGLLAPAALAFILLTIGARMTRGLAQVASRPLPWIDRAIDALALIGLAAATGWAWTWSGQWGVAALSIVTAADTAMATEDEQYLERPLAWRADAPAFAGIIGVASLADSPVAALIACAAYASASFATIRRRLKATLTLR